ncbi:MAG TPA: hypothetical protein VJR23_07400 [Candidatus Acidoferrales bacterium]|nr:hypothetical protein [Candidatus Acidoferrales bacterium]
MPLHQVARKCWAILFPFVFVAILLAFPAPARAQAPAKPQSHLTLSAAIEKQEYCLKPDGQTNLRLSLRLEFRNISNEKVILFQKSNIVDGIDLTGPTSGQMAMKWPHIAIDRVIPSGQSVVPASPGDDFAFLKPEKTLRTNAVVHIDLLHSNLPGGGLVNPGQYSLAVSVATWNGSYDAAGVARQQWRRSGYLITEDILSAPISFSISSNPQFHDCNWNE